MEFFAYAVFILALAAPFVLAFGLLRLLLFGSGRVVSSIRREQRVDIVGIASIAAALVTGMIAYHWLRGPAAEMATLRPLVVDRQLAAKLPRTWVVDYAAPFEAFDLLSHKYVGRLLKSRISGGEQLASIPQGQRDAFMEEIRILDSPSCKSLMSSGLRDPSRTLECVTYSTVKKADVVASGPYITLENDDSIDHTQTVTFTLVEWGSTTPIARCEGRAPREANPILALIRGNRSRDVASSIHSCKMRAAAGALSRVIATGTIE